MIQTIQSVAHELHHKLEHKQLGSVDRSRERGMKNPSAGKRHHSFEQSDSEDALTAWLREGGVSDAWKIAPVLVGAGLEIDRGFALRQSTAHFDMSDFA